MKILAITGIRSDYDILAPVLRELGGRGHDVRVVASGAHLSGIHGFTLDRIRQDGFEVVDCVDSLLATDRATQRAKGVALLTLGLAQTVERERPDLMIVLGDREEPLAVAIVGNYMGVLTVHLAAGDPVYRNADDPVRHAVSKLGHVLVAFTAEYARNLVRMGEEPFRVLHSGNPAIDQIMREPELPDDAVSKALGFDINSEKFVVFLKHPLSSTVEDTEFQIKTALEGARRFSDRHGVHIVGIYPNTDPGSTSILRAIEETEAVCPRVRFHQTLPRDVFVNVMRRALALAGNSSMGILESMIYPFPVVNIGPRQTGRLHSGNVEFVSYDEEAIAAALEKACFDEAYRGEVRGMTNVYGDGRAAKRIADFLEQIDRSDAQWLVKQHLKHPDAAAVEAAGALPEVA